MEEMTSIFQNYTLQVVALGSCLLGMSSGAVGCFALLRKQSLLGDTVAHGALPGIILAFLLLGSKNMFLLTAGALISAVISCIFIEIITRNSRIKYDSALAMTVAVSFGLGMILLTICQKIPNAQQAGLDRFIYGQAAAMLQEDVLFLLMVVSCITGNLLLFWKEFKLLTFDKIYGNTSGFQLPIWDFLLTFLIVLAIIAGLQTVGVILMSSMLIAPGVSASRWVKSLEGMVILAGLLGGLSSVVGTIVTSVYSNLPTGAVIALCISIIAFFSLLFGTNRGIFWNLPWVKEKILVPMEKRCNQTTERSPTHEC